MAGPVEVAEATLELERATEALATNWEAFLRAHPELTRVAPPRVPGWVAWIAVGAYWLGTIPTRPEGVPDNLIAVYEHTAETLRLAVAYLESHELEGDELRSQLDGIRSLTQTLAHLRRELERVTPPVEVATATPTAILRQELAQLRRTVAVQELWRGGHHGRVHRPLATAEVRLAGAEVATASATGAALSATVQAIRAVVQVRLPELRRELVTLLRGEAQARRSNDVELRTELRQSVREVTQRIGDIVRWLRTEALPEIRTELRAARQELLDYDRMLRQRLAAEEEARADADLALAAGLATASAWIAGTGTHVAEKVRRTESVFDQLLRSNDLNWAAQLLSAGPFVALVGAIMGRIAGQVPETLVGLEEAAVRALGAVR